MYNLFFVLFLLTLPIEAIYKYEDFREEDVIGLEDFLSKLDERTQELVVELLEAKQIENLNEQNRRMRNIMREQDTSALDNLIHLYKETNPKSSSSYALPYIPFVLITLLV